MTKRDVFAATCAAWLAACGGGAGGTTPPTPAAEAPSAVPPTPTATPTPTPTATPTPTPTPTPTATPSLTPNATPAATCAALLPSSLPAAVAHSAAKREPDTWYEQCAATSDAGGTHVIAGPGRRFWRFDVLPIEGGEPVARFSSPALDRMVALASGFHALWNDSGWGELYAFDASGTRTVLRHVTDPIAIERDPSGGSVLLTHQRIADPTGIEGRYERRIQWLDASATVTASVVADDAVWLLAVAPSGNVLVGDAERHVRWYGREGPLTAPIDVAEMMTFGGLLADGTVALGAGYEFTDRGRRWTAVVRDGETDVSPAPEWLRKIERFRTEIVRGGDATAFLPEPRICIAQWGTPIVPEVEIVTAAGEPCGKVVLPLDGCIEGLSIGADGTVFAGWTTEDHATCEFRWWPALLR
jgi:hypothetical protein